MIKQLKYMTIDEEALYKFLKENKGTIEFIFNQISSDENYKKLVNENKWDVLITEVSPYILDICVKAGIDFLPYLRCIHEYSFNQCPYLIKIEIPSNISSIGKKAFSRCSILEEVYIPKSVNHIYKEAFAEIPDLIISYEGTKKEWVNIIKEPDWRKNSYIKVECFDGVVYEY